MVVNGQWLMVNGEDSVRVLEKEAEYASALAMHQPLNVFSAFLPFISRSLLKAASRV